MLNPAGELSFGLMCAFSALSLSAATMNRLLRKPPPRRLDGYPFAPAKLPRVRRRTGEQD